MQPVLFRLGSAIVSSYSFMLSLSFVVGTLIFVGLIRRQNISINKLFGLVISIQLAALLGSRLLYVINNYERFESNFLAAFSISPGGFAVNGGFLLGVLTGYLYIRLNHLPFWNIADFAAPSLALGVFFTKMGCFLGGCCHGKAASLSWGVQFPQYSLAAQKYGIPHHVHPTQLYEAGSGIIIFFILFQMLKHRRFEGQVFLSFAIFYFLIRFLNDILRGDIIYNYVFNFSQTQFFSVVFVLIALVFGGVKLRSNVRNAKTPSSIQNPSRVKLAVIRRQNKEEQSWKRT